MSICFDAADLTETSGNMTALAARFASQTWKYKTDNASEVRYEGYLPSPYDSNEMAVQIVIPVATDGTHNYSQSTFFFIATPNLKLAFPEPSDATRTLMVSITEVGDWVEGVVDSAS